jgi:hypothetical protein
MAGAISIAIPLLAVGLAYAMFVAALVSHSQFLTSKYGVADCLNFLQTQLSAAKSSPLDYLWILVLGVFIVRMVIPFRSEIKTQYMSIQDKDDSNKKIPLGKAEKKHYDDFRTHSITLASFTMTVIAVIVALPGILGVTPADQQARHNVVDQSIIDHNIKSLFYLSLAMISFFISSYLFLLRENRWFVYTGESLEYMGIVAVGIGLLSLMLNVTNSWFLGIVYLVFVIGITIIALIQIRISVRFFHPKKKTE